MSRQNLIERSLEAYSAHQRKRGFDVDEVSFVAGWMSCFGVLTGRLPVGLPEETSILAVFEMMQKELDGYRTKVIGKAE